MRKHNSSGICVEQFVRRLLRESEISVENDDGMVYGYNRGWLQEQDISGRQQPLQKKHCARIIHEFLRHEQKEPDEIDSGPAGKLQDLFDCRVCVGHVMQVYSKGIMEGYHNQDKRYVFGMENYVSNEQAEQIILRVFRTELRTPKHTEVAGKQAKCVSLQEAVLVQQQESDSLLIDVRTETEYAQGHLEGALHLPMMCILKNPYIVSERRDIHVLLYCAKGYMSETAAQSLVRAGYENVSYFAWNQKMLN